MVNFSRFNPSRLTSIHTEHARPPDRTHGPLTGHGAQSSQYAGPVQPSGNISRPTARHRISLQAADVEPELQWLLAERNRNADLMITAPAQQRNARRRLRSILHQHGQDMLYLDNPQSLDDLDTTLHVENGRPVLCAGPFRLMLQRGGTLVLNVARFSPQELEGFNTLVEEQTWKGERLPNKVKTIYLCDSNTLQKGRLSGAVVSRAIFRDMSQHEFPEAGDPAFTEAQETYPLGTQVIDLQGDSNWRFRLFGGPELALDQTWRMREPLVDMQASTPLCLRGVLPDDADLMDQIAALRENGRTVWREHGIPLQEHNKLTANKQALPNKDLPHLHWPDAPVFVVNSCNLIETLEGSYGAEGGQLRRHPSILEQASKGPSGKRPIVYVSHLMPEPFWDRLMLHPQSFLVAAAAGVPVPYLYKDLVTTVNRGAEATSHASIEPASESHGPVGFLFTADPTLIDYPADARKIFITPDTRSDTLISRLNMTQTPGTALPEFSNDTQQLLIDLVNGETVFLHGLDKNPALVEELAPLIHPPHRLHFNGEYLDFGKDGKLNGKLNGRLIIVTSKREVLDAHPLSPVYHDGFDTNNQEHWKSAVLDKLTAAFPQEDGNRLQMRLDSLLGLLKHMPALNKQTDAPFPASYSMIEKLFRHFPDSSLATRDGGDNPRWKIQRAVFKDILLGDYRQFDRNADERYAYLKAMLKVTFPEEMSPMAPQTFDIDRLRSLLSQVIHPKQVREHVWQFINLFSPDVIRKIIGQTAEDRGAEDAERLAPMVLALIHQAAAEHGVEHGVELPSSFHGHDAPAAGVDDGIGKLTPHSRMRKQEPGQKVRDKIEETGRRDNDQRRGRARFFKGPPGTGKTHFASRIANDGRNTLVAATGTAADESILKQWATATEPPLLIIDEANLAKEGSHDIFRGLLTEGSMLIDGQRYQLSEMHQVVFTGNADDYPGRTRHDIAADAFATIIFKPTQAEDLRDRHARPLVGKALARSLPKRILHRLFAKPTVRRLEALFHAQPAGFKQYIIQHGVEIHAAFQQAYSNKGFSLRNLEEFVTQVICSLKSGAAPSTPAELAPWMVRLALDVYAGGLPFDERPIIDIWLRRHFNVPAHTVLPRLPVAELKSDRLVLTDSTRELGSRILWWLDTQNKRRQFNHKPNALGQQALLIEGPASRGKDEIVKAALETGNYRYLHVNASPTNPEQLKDDIRQAREEGLVLVVSEMTLYDSKQLERILNPVLTGDVPAHPNFRLIATVNPADYAGRKSMSPALQNRMQMLVIPSYEPAELREIARGLAQRRSGNRLTKLAARLRLPGSRDMALPRLTEETVNALVERHIGLNKELAAYSEQHQPTIRELRASIESLSRNSFQTAGTVINENYAYYLRLADASGGAALNVASADMDDPVARKTQLLQLALKLTYPSWLSLPEFSSVTNSEQAVRYDPTMHRLEFDADRAISQLCNELLELAVNSFQVPVREMPGPKETGVQLPIQNDTSQHSPAVQPQSFNSNVPLPTSGVGSPPKEGYIGTIHNYHGEIYLNTMKATLDEKTCSFERQQFNEAESRSSQTLTAKLPRIELNNVRVDHTASGKRIIYLLATSETRPTSVLIDGTPATTVYRDEHGGWYVHADDSAQASVKALTYALASYQDPDATTSERKDKGKSKAKFFNGLDLNLSTSDDELDVDNDNAKSAVEAISRLWKQASRVNMTKHEIAESLKTILKNPRFFLYSDDDTQALNAAPDLTARFNRFLRAGKGVCFEFAGTYAAILEQVFGIATRQCSGYYTQSDRIPAQKHQWVEYADAANHWHRIDPTPSAPVNNRAGHPGAVPDERAIKIAAGRRNPTSSLPWIQLNSWTELNIPPELLNNHFSPGKLGLEYWDMQDDTEKFNPYSGDLVLKRVFQGERNIYRRAATSAVMRFRRVYIEGLPQQNSERETETLEFLCKLLRPLQALIRSNVEVFIYDVKGNPRRIDSADELQSLLLLPQKVSTDMTLPGNERAVIANNEKRDFFGNLMSAYYNAVLDFRGIDRDNHNAVKNALAMDLYPLMVQSGTTGIKELTLTLNGSDYLITQADIDTISEEIKAQTRSATNQLYNDLDPKDGTKRKAAMDALDNKMVKHHIDGLTGRQRLVYINNTTLALREINDHDFSTWAFRHMHALATGMQLSKLEGNGRVIVTVVNELIGLFKDGHLRMDNGEQVDRFIALLKEFPAHSVDGGVFARSIAPNLESWIGKDSPLDKTQKIRFNIAIRRLDSDMA